MPNILDNPEEIQKVDVSNALSSIEQIASQIQQIWDLSQQLSFDPSYSDISNVVVAGMGGSAYGTQVIQTLFKDELKVPVTVVPDYTLPAYVNKHTLVIASSYSGSSEETLSAVEDAVKKGAKLTGLTSGGKLGEFLKSQAVPHIVFEPTFNPCGVARFGYGYSLFGQIALFAKLGLITFTQDQLMQILDTIATEHLSCSVSVSQDKNVAKLLAFEMFEKIPVLVVSEHLEGMAHVVANAFNENAKTFSEYRVIPEMNHHLLEGFEFPHAADSDLVFVSVDSHLYSKANHNRLLLTQQLFDKFHLQDKVVTVTGKTTIQEAFSLLMIGVYTSFYLAMLYDKDPAGTPQVDWFKSQLKKM